MGNNSILITGSLNYTTKDTPTRIGERINSLSELKDVENPYVGQIIYVVDTNSHIFVKSLKSKQIGGFLINNAEIDSYQTLLTNAGLATLEDRVKNVETTIESLDNEVSSEDDFVSVVVKQTDGKIDSVEVTTNDIAKASELEKVAENAKTYKLVKSDTNLESNIKEVYWLEDQFGNISTEKIKIYKDSHLKSVNLEEQELVFTYFLADGQESVVRVDISKFIVESEFADGLDVNNHVVSVKIDETSETFLAVSADGVKLSGVQTAIDNAKNALQDELDALDQKGFLVGEETSEELDDVETNTYVKYVAQTLTEEQKAQARNNIGAPSMEQLMTMYQELLDMINNLQNQAPTVATLDKSVLDNTRLA